MSAANILSPFFLLFTHGKHSGNPSISVDSLNMNGKSVTECRGGNNSD